MADGSAPDTEPQQEPRPVLRTRLIVAGVALLVIFLLVWPVFSMLQPAYYQRYPALRERMHNWSTSTHSVWSCAACHVGPGLGNQVGFAFKAIPAFYSQLLTGPSKTNLLQPPTNEACRQCHTMYRTVSPGGDLRIPHRAHVVVLKLRCVLCHQHLVHWPNAQGFNRPRMTFCITACHNGKKATNKCAKCHTQKQVPPSHKQANWLAVHGKRTHEIKCGTCHGWAPKLCETCHKNRPSTHKGNWKKLHQARAKLEGKGCLVCHGGRTFCLKCHDASVFKRL